MEEKKNKTKMLRRAFSHIARKCDRSRCVCLEKLQSAGSNPDTIDIARKRLAQCLTLRPTDDRFEPPGYSDPADGAGGHVGTDVGEDGAP